MKKPVLCFLGLGLLGLLGLSLLVNFLLLAAGGSRARARGETAAFHAVHHSGQPGGGQVAIIDLQGLISYGAPGTGRRNMVDEFLAKLKQAGDTDAIHAVLLRVNSPGGEVTASDVIYRAVKKLDRQKPVVAYIQTVGASGAYYSALGARHLMANELSLTASIGVIMQTMNFQGLADKVGVQSLTFKSGKMKDLLNPFRPATDEEQAYVQALIDETYGKFVGIVAAERQLDEEQLRAGVADGRVVSGKTAAREHLIDATGYLEDAIAKARELAGLPDHAEVVELQAPFSLAQLFRILGHAPIDKIELHLGPRGAELQAGQLYYLTEMNLAR
ncbi:MAG: signal peptide peptidase SppA [Verrucomicrobiales bacterium]|nr:signal peptide peptidase SppA [Verrucomicrobiales bacterium]